MNGRKNQLHVALVNAVRNAGTHAIVNRRIASVERKGHRDIVTRVDRENEAGIKDALRKVDPHISFLGEEGGIDRSGVLLVTDPQVLAVVDPLDATVNFALGRKEFSVMAAILEDGIVKFAVISIPAFNELFIAERGKGAFLNDERITVSAVSVLSDAVISCNRSNYRTEADMQVGLRIIAGLMKHARSWRNFGTTGFEYTDVARGRLDGIITPIAEAVHVAGYLMMEEAGARVTDENGNATGLDSKMIVAAPAAIHEALLRMVQDSITV